MKSMYSGVIVLLLVTAYIFWQIVWQNLESKALMLAFWAVVAATITFGLALFYELKEIKDHHQIEASLSIYHDESAKAYKLFIGETGHTQTIADAMITENSYQKAMVDFLLLRLVDSLMYGERDWQKEIKVDATGFRSMTAGRQSQEEKGKDAYVSNKDLYSSLHSLGNLLSQQVSHNEGGVFLPPESQVIITNKTFQIENPFVELCFTIIPQSGISTSYVNGEEPRVKIITKKFNIVVDIAYKKERSRNKFLPKYKEWANRLANDCLVWSIKPMKDFYFNYKPFWSWSSTNTYV